MSKLLINIIYSAHSILFIILNFESFLSLQVNAHFNITLQLNRVLRDRLTLGANIKPKSDLYSDVYDGQIYKTFYQENLVSIQKGETFSLILNTDGVSLCEKSRLSITPIILSINEMPLTERYCIENVIIAGMIYSFKVLL